MRLPALLLALSAALAHPVRAAAQPATVILVRHAERAPAPPADPVLSEAGDMRARALHAALASAGISAIVTTQFQRTQLTARPLADALGLVPIIVRAATPLQAHLDSVAAVVMRQPPGSVVLVVGHSNTIPAIIGALGGPKIRDLCDSQYASLFVLTPAPGTRPRLIQATFGAADPPDSDACARTMRQ